MKQNIYALALGLTGLALTPTTVSAQAPPRRTCASVEVLQAQLAADPAMAQRMAAINNQAVQYAARQANLAQRASSAIAVTIPVVVHVVYNTAAENISDAQIQSQIDVLNEDFHKLNADAGSVPAAFAGLAADPGIQFVLAKRTPSGLATNGIERKSSTTASWGTADKIKKASTGGLNAWNASQYLNLWVGTIGGGILGYAQFPGSGAAATDGVVISPAYFGRTGTVTSPYNLGRTASHEVGHWLNLNHIWGDDGGACTGTDNVDDTPNQGAENYGKPVFPHVSCANGPNGDMFMSYMDYVDDNAMFMFSTGQSQRMNALFAAGGPRVGLLTSQGGVAPGGTTPTPTPTPSTVTYCASKGASVAYEYIDYVELGTIARTSRADKGYYNGTASSTSVAAGSAQTIRFSAGFVGTAYSEYVKVYIDYNQNGVFTDAGELVVNAATSSSALTRTESFTVPTTAKSGNTRLRVVLSDASTTTSCGSYSYGETEDYTLNISGGTRVGNTARLNGGGAADHYTLYPNPATDVLSIARPTNADPEQAFSVRVYDLRGAEVRGLAFANGQLNVSPLRAGIYLLTVNDGNTTSHQRFVKE